MFDEDEDGWFGDAGAPPTRVAALSREQRLARAQQEGAAHGITVSTVSGHYDALASVRTCALCGQHVGVRGPAAAWDLAAVTVRLDMSHQPATCETIRHERTIHVQWGLNYE